MPIINFKFSPHPSPAYQQVFREGLRHLVRLGRIPEGLEIESDPAPVYVLSLKRNAPKPAQPPNAQLVGWRFFASDSNGNVVAGDISATTPPKLSGLIYGDDARAALKAMVSARKQPPARTQGHELRLLRIPGALVQGFWLKPPTPENGLFVPYRPGFDGDRQQDIATDLDEYLNKLRPVEPPPRNQGEPPPRLK
jgi:hypothetical protein